jgi:hypothetical protein
MKGDRFALSGVNPFAGTFPRNTSCDLMTSMRVSNRSVHAMKAVNAIALGEDIANLSDEA